MAPSKWQATIGTNPVLIYWRVCAPSRIYKLFFARCRGYWRKYMLIKLCHDEFVAIVSRLEHRINSNKISLDVSIKNVDTRLPIRCLRGIILAASDLLIEWSTMARIGHPNRNVISASVGVALWSTTLIQTPHKHGTSLIGGLVRAIDLPK